MRAKLNLQEMNLADLHPAEYNPRVELKPGDPEYERIKRSIETFTYVDPIIVNRDGTIIGGHQRYNVLLDLGYETADVVVVDKGKEEEKALNIALNKISGEWDEEMLSELLGALETSGFDADATGFSRSERAELMRGIDLSKLESTPESGQEMSLEQMRDSAAFSQVVRELGEEAERPKEYNDFVEKFKPKLTTDDCFTPELIYEAVKAWALKEYKWEGRTVVRPFYPGGDYQNYAYPDGCIVIDNPPFSIMAEVVGFYEERKIDYFLFAPRLTCMGIRAARSRVIISVNVVYENGARVPTSFVCSVGPVVRSAPDLEAAVDDANRKSFAGMSNELPAYKYPDNVITASVVAQMSKYGVGFRVDDAVFIRKLDAQAGSDKVIFGGGFLVSDELGAKAAEARAKAAEARAKAAEARKMIYELSEREKRIVESLNKAEKK